MDQFEVIVKDRDGNVVYGGWVKADKLSSPEAQFEAVLTEALSWDAEMLPRTAEDLPQAYPDVE